MQYKTISTTDFTICVNYVQLENNPTTKTITFQVLFETVNTDQYNPQQELVLGFPHAYGLFNSTSTSLIYFNYTISGNCHIIYEMLKIKC